MIFSGVFQCERNSSREGKNKMPTLRRGMKRKETSRCPCRSGQAQMTKNYVI